MNILLTDDLGNKKEFLDHDPATPFIPSEHAVECRMCKKWVLDEDAIEDEKGRFYCSVDCYGESRVERKRIFR